MLSVQRYCKGSDWNREATLPGFESTSIYAKCRLVLWYVVFGIRLAEEVSTSSQPFSRMYLALDGQRSRSFRFLPSLFVPYVKSIYSSGKSWRSVGTLTDRQF